MINIYSNNITWTDYDANSNDYIPTHNEYFCFPISYRDVSEMKSLFLIH